MISAKKSIKKLAAPHVVLPVQKIPTGPLSPLMRKVVIAMYHTETGGSHWGMTGNEIGYAVGFRGGEVKANVSGAAASGGCVRSMGAAQKVIPVIVALDRRGLIAFAARRDGRSGTAYRLTPEGIKIATELQKEMKVADTDTTRTDAKTADGGEKAVWVLDESVDAGNLDPIAAADIMFLPGDAVRIDDEHEMYPGEEGIVQSVGRGIGHFGGQPTYDVLVEGTSEAERFPESDLEAA